MYLSVVILIFIIMIIWTYVTLVRVNHNRFFESKNLVIEQVKKKKKKKKCLWRDCNRDNDSKMGSK